MESKALKLWKWSAILLLILNLGVITMTLMRPPVTIQQQEGTAHHPPHPPHPHMRPDQFIIEELKLDQNQQKKFQSLKKGHRAAIDSLLKAGKKLREELFDHLKTNPDDDTSYIRIIDQIALNQAEIEKITYDHFQDIRSICNSDQQKVFDAIVSDLAKRLAGPPPPPAPPPPPSAPDAPIAPPSPKHP